MQEMSLPLSLTGLEGLFPRYSTLYNAAPPLPDLHLRDALEKESARRKHLERHIQNLQNEMLELQQRVSVTLTADRRKDAMIQQLDQTLALVVGGWKQQEQQREETMRGLRLEKEAAVQARTGDQEVLAQMRQELSQALESQERDQQEARERQRELQRQINEQTARVCQLQAKLAAEEESRAAEHRELESLRYRMQEQQKSWEEKERELQEESQRAQEEGKRELEKEKAVSQQEIQKSQQWQLALSSLQGDVLRLERELQASHRESDALQMELNLEKARNESERVRLESEHKMRLEEVITERLSALQEESTQHLCTIREQHRKQLLELTSQHEAELSNQLSQFKSEIQERERRHRDVIMDWELKLSRSDERSQELSRSLLRLESERTEMLSQLQDVMKSHWSQALRVLTAKAPTEGSSLTLPPQKADRWTSEHTREGVYGEETSDQTRQALIGASCITNSTGQLTESSSSHRISEKQVMDSHTQNQSGGKPYEQNGSQSLEDGARSGHQLIADGPLKESGGSDLINFSRLLDDQEQNVVGDFNLRQSRVMGDGAQFGSKFIITHNPSNQSFLDNNQPKSQTTEFCKAFGTVEPTRQIPFISGLFGTRGQENLQEFMAGDASRNSIFQNNIKETVGQSSMDSRQKSAYLGTVGYNIADSDPITNLSGHSVAYVHSQPASIRINSMDDFRASLMSSSQPVVCPDKRNVHVVGRSHIRDQDGFSFTSGHNQPIFIRDSTKQDISQSMVDGRLFRDINSLVSHPVSPISKETIQGPSQKINYSGFREEPISSHQPSHRAIEVEESFHPMHMEDLSHSFSSHLGFFPLEPHPDRTASSSVSTSLPQTSPEHPFQEETSTTGIPPNEDRLTPNPVLQYYIRMLLDCTPGDLLTEMEKDQSCVNPEVMELHRYIAEKNQPPQSSGDNQPDVSKHHPNTKKPPVTKAPEAVKKEVLTNPRRSNPAKPLRRVSSRGARTGVWK